ncbi:ribulose-phosphate 3-epimerase [Methylomarinovum tepidoasis]|uniref:ribulose-phosphate 3-epimerase n=1 Tax=Methylomarinovum tepidoasis TaxID=2840183 RepID=UPI002572AC23|nr:ribulose-phosphate 3-epimerase [Methylomarinovum sp. IN45]
MSQIEILPSLICADPNRRLEAVRELESLGVDGLHVDILDGHFSPSLPLGIEAVRQLRRETGLPFDAHLMVADHAYFIDALLDCGVQRLCFHAEAEPHIDRWLQTIQAAGVAPGVALKPATPLSVLEYCLERIDFALLMLINPGFAGHKGEAQVPYARRKVAACRRFLDERGAGHVAIEIDGRVGFDNLADLVAAGADRLVAGTRSLFHPKGSLADNLARMRRLAAEGLKRRKDG